MPKTDGDRVVADLKRLAEFGRYKSGVHRPTYSAEDVASRQWLADKFAEAGLDGALGVIYGLELARAFAADPALAGLGVEAVAWADEEGHYGNMLGSRSFTGGLSEDEIEAAESREGKKLRQALVDAGFAGRPRELVDPARYVGYLEAHIEQGDTLVSAESRIGIVEGIVGIWNYWVTLSGEQNHAGTTQMRRRKDAGSAMVRLATRIHDRFAEIAGPRTVWTIGRMLLDPNAPSIVPGRGEMQVQFRDTDTNILESFERTLHELVAEADRAGPCRVAIAPLSKTAPAAMDPGFQRLIEAAAERHAPGRHLRMPSGAGHDAQILSRRMRSGMMFVPSLKGISHHWAEDTREADIVLGAQVFADAAAAILRGA